MKAHLLLTAIQNRTDSNINKLFYRRSERNFLCLTQQLWCLQDAFLKFKHCRMTDIVAVLFSGCKRIAANSLPGRCVFGEGIIVNEI